MSSTIQKIVSGIVSTAIAVGIVPQIQLFSRAEASTRTPYAGFDDTGVSYLRYDSSVVPSTEWYNDATGTEDDPYIIDSVEDIMGLHYATRYSLGEYLDSPENEMLRRTTGIYESYVDSVYIPNDAKSIEDVYVIQGTNEYATLAKSIMPLVSCGSSSYGGSNYRSYSVSFYYKAYRSNDPLGSNITMVNANEYMNYARIRKSYVSSADNLFSWDVKILDEDINDDGLLDFQIHVVLDSKVGALSGRSITSDYTTTKNMSYFDASNTLRSYEYVDPTSEDHYVTAVNLAGEALQINLNDEVPAGTIYRVDSSSNKGYVDFRSNYSSRSDSTTSIWPERKIIYNTFGMDGIRNTSVGSPVTSRLYSYCSDEYDISALSDLGAVLFAIEADYGKRIYGKHVNSNPAYSEELFYADVKGESQLRLEFDEINGETVLCINEYATDNCYADPEHSLRGLSPKTRVWLRFNGVDFSQFSRYLGFETNTLTYNSYGTKRGQVYQAPDIMKDIPGNYNYTYAIYSFIFEDAAGGRIVLKPDEWCSSETGVFTSWNPVDLNENTEYYLPHCPQINLLYPAANQYIGYGEATNRGDVITYESDCEYWTSLVDGHSEGNSMVYIGSDLLDNDISAILTNQAMYAEERTRVNSVTSLIADPTFEGKHFKIAADFWWEGPPIVMTEQYGGEFKGNFDFDGHLFVVANNKFAINTISGNVKNVIAVPYKGAFINCLQGNLADSKVVTYNCLKSVMDNQYSSGSFVKQISGTADKICNISGVSVIRDCLYCSSIIDTADYVSIADIDILFVNKDATGLTIPSTDEFEYISYSLVSSIENSVIKNVAIDADTDSFADTFTGVPLSIFGGLCNINTAFSCSFDNINISDFNIAVPMTSSYLPMRECSAKDVCFKFSNILDTATSSQYQQYISAGDSRLQNVDIRVKTLGEPGYFYLCNCELQDCEIGVYFAMESESTNELSAMFEMDNTTFSRGTLYCRPISGSSANLYCRNFLKNYSFDGKQFDSVLFDCPIDMKVSDCVNYTSKVTFNDCTFNFGAISSVGSYGTLFSYHGPSLSNLNSYNNAKITIQELDCPKMALFGGAYYDSSNIAVNGIESLWSLGNKVSINNTKINLNYSDTVSANDGLTFDTNQHCCDILTNSEVFVGAPDGAVGQMNAPINLYKTDNAFVYMDLSNTDIAVIPKGQRNKVGTIFGTACYISLFYDKMPAVENSTFIFKGKLYNSQHPVVSMSGYTRSLQQGTFDNVNIIANITEVGGTDVLPALSAAYTDVYQSLLVHGLNCIIDYETTAPIIGVLHAGSGAAVLVDSVSVLSSSSSNKQSLIDVVYPSYGSNMSVTNSILYTPNNPADYSTNVSGLLSCSASGLRSVSPGLANAVAAWFTSDYSSTFYNCLVGRGQSIQSYDPAGGSVDMSVFSSACDSRYPGADWDVNAGKTFAGIKELETDNVLSGEAAYILDRGSAYNRRGYNWTVYDNVGLFDPNTSEILTTIPAHVGPIGMYIPEQYLGGVSLADDPIYRVSVKPAVDGEIKITGLADIATADGAVYVKRGMALEADETAFTDEVSLIYALESLNGGSDVRIPNQATPSTAADVSISSYSIDGYRLPGADVDITPVFKVAREVTIAVDNNEHGTIIPSEYISAEGEKVYLSIVTDSGYSLSDIYWNTVSDPSTTYPISLADMELVMPADDIVIHGTVIPMECGITKFKVFGFDGVIDQVRGTIDVWVPKIGQLNHVIPEISYYGDYIAPGETSFVDLTVPCTYTVYKGSAEKSYTVNVHQSEYSMRIYSFKLNGVAGEINQATQKITVKLPMDTDISNLTPEILYSAEAITPAETEPQDFRMPIVYTLYATGITPVPYTVEVTLAASSEAVITDYALAGYGGVIDEETKEIVVTVPAALSLTHITPNLVRYIGKSITPSKVAGINATVPVEYEVTAQNNSITAYSLIVHTLSDDVAKITDFSLGGIEGDIDEVNHKITVEVPATTNLVDVVPDELVYEGKSIYPPKISIQDFTSPVEYTVVAVDNTEVTYTVEVTKMSDAALITEFALYDIDGVINQADRTITVELPYGYATNDLIPTKLVYSQGATLTPSKITSRDFSSPVQYTVTSEDNSVTNVYTVTVTVRERYDNLITKYTLDGVDGVITNIGAHAGVIYLTVNEKYPAVDFSRKCPDEILISALATIDKDATVAVDYIGGVPEYTVTGRYNGERVYKVYLTVIPLDTTAKITSFVANGHVGVIDDEAGIITLTAAESERPTMTSVVPQIRWQGRSISPSAADAVNLTLDSITYTVQAEHPAVSKAYRVVVTWIDSDCCITEYQIGGISAVISQNTGDMHLRIPKSRKHEFDAPLVPDRIIWTGDTLSPEESASVQVFNSPTYTVTSSSGDTKIYTVSTEVYDDTIVSDVCSIDKFVFKSLVGSINQNTNVITFTIHKTNIDRYTGSAIPDEIVWRGESISPNESVPVDIFGSPEYTVTAESGRMRTYVIKVKIIALNTPDPIPPEPVDDCSIEYYEALGVVGDIDQTHETITLRIDVSLRDKLQNVIPDMIRWTGVSLQPNEQQSVTLADGLQYIVTAESGRVRVYTIKLEWLQNSEYASECGIYAYTANGVHGAVNQEKKTIRLSVSEDEKGLWTSVVPEYIMWQGDVLTPSTNDAVNLEAGVMYRVFAEDHKYYKDYLVTINWIPTSDEVTEETEDTLDTDCDIISYKANDVLADIDREACTIKFKAPLSQAALWSSVIPDEIIWVGDVLMPTDSESVDIASGVEYTVYAENPEYFKVYRVSVEFVPEIPGTIEDEDVPYTGVAATRVIHALLFATLAAGAFVATRKRHVRK